MMRQPLRVNGGVFLCSLGVPLLLGLTGCLATQGWVQEQMIPLAERVSVVEGRFGESEARLQVLGGKTDVALDRLDNLRLERRFMLNLKNGAQFDVDSATMPQETRRQIDQFVDSTKDVHDAVFVVVGHTDSTGSENYNFELGQKRAASVARYLISRKRMDPLLITAVSYGESAPLTDNMTREGRRKNRRIEILVYKESITSSSPGEQRLDLERSH
jgi:peptidoglycan-associated lipoprotein